VHTRTLRGEDEAGAEEADAGDDGVQGPGGIAERRVAIDDDTHRHHHRTGRAHHGHGAQAGGLAGTVTLPTDEATEHGSDERIEEDPELIGDRHLREELHASTV